MNELTILLVMILFPGVLLTIIYDNYTEHKPWDSFKYILYSVTSGVITYFTLQILVILFQFIYNIEEYKNTNWYILSVWELIKGSKNVSINPVEILLAGILSIFLGLLAVKANRTNVINNILNKLSITDKYGDDSVFIKTIQTLCINNDYIEIIILDEDITAQGLIYFYKDANGVIEIALTGAVIFETSSSKELFKAEIFTIAKEFKNIILYKKAEDLPEENNEHQ